MRGQIWRLILILGVISALIIAVQIGGLRLALDKLGLSPESAGVILLVSLFGSFINLPLIRLPADDTLMRDVRWPFPWPRPVGEFKGSTLITANLGGCVVPVLFSLSLLIRYPVPYGALALATVTVTAVSYFFSRPIPGLGIGMPVLVAPLTAALIAGLLASDYAPGVAYIAGTWGVLLGADVLRLRDILRMGVPYAHIGGAGTFDGVFITGIVAVLLT